MTLKKGIKYTIFFNEIHHDPIQWREPHRFVPDRFDTRTLNNFWSLTTEGKQRNPLSFTPFFGGKRIFLGKTFAETVVKFTVPLIFHHVDFAFANPEIQANSKDVYAASGAQELLLPIKFTTRNIIQM